MAHILLAGDSWGIGVFSGEGDNYGPTGQGIHTILQNYGHQITNISKAGGSNWLMLDRMENQWWDTGRCLYGHSHIEEITNIDWNTIDYVVFLQTDIFREHYLYVNKDKNDNKLTWKKLDDAFVDSIFVYDTLQNMIDDYFLKFYTKLNSIGIQQNKKILLLGCWSKLHPSISKYNNLIPVAVSSTQLLIPDLKEDVYLSDPEWYTELSEHKEFMKKYGLEFKPMTLDATQKLERIYSEWKEVHPSINGYNLLVDKILPYLSVQ
jgi:hypothetical protein